MASFTSKLRDLPIDKQGLLLKSKREELFAAATKIFTQSKTATESKSDSFNTYFDRLKLLEKKFEETLELIDFYNVSIEDPSLKLDNSQVYSSFIDIVDSARINFIKLSKTIPNRTPEPSAGTSSPSQLPRLHLPTFSGKIEDWIEFQTSFNSLVDNDSSLTVSKKYQYLRTALRGDALAVISQLDFTPENYPLALEALKLRYDNKRRLANLYLDKIMALKQIKNSSTDFHKVLTGLETCWNAIDKLGIPDLKDFLKLYLSVNKLDPVSRRDFEKLYKTNTFPKYQDLVNFLTENARVDEFLSPQKRADQPNKCPEPKEKATGTYRPSNNFSIESNLNLDSVKDKSSPKKGPGTKSSSISASPESANVRPKLVCWNCGGPHVYSKCREPRQRFCYRCGAKGVTTTNCTSCKPENGQGTK